jgi:hypothetical protein
MQEWGSRDCINSDATIKAFSRMSDQGFIGVRRRSYQPVLESSTWETTVEGS